MTNWWRLAVFSVDCSLVRMFPLQKSNASNAPRGFPKHWGDTCSWENRPSHSNLNRTTVCTSTKLKEPRKKVLKMASENKSALWTVAARSNSDMMYHTLLKTLKNHFCAVPLSMETSTEEIIGWRKWVWGVEGEALQNRLFTQRV